MFRTLPLNINGHFDFFDDFTTKFTELARYENSDWIPRKCAVLLKDESLDLAFSVQGYDPKSIEIQCSVDKIHIKSKRLEKSKDEETGVVDQFLSKIDETIKLMPEFDGTKAEAEIKFGLLKLTIPKKESSKSVLLKPKF